MVTILYRNWRNIKECPLTCPARLTGQTIAGIVCLGDPKTFWLAAYISTATKGSPLFMQTQAVEDYLKTIFDIQRAQGKVATTVLAERLGVAPASVTGMLKKLAQLSLVQYEKYQGVRLTAAGEKIALEVIRHHRLIELYLAEALGVPWDRVHEEAEKWEHVLSEYLEDRM